MQVSCATIFSEKGDEVTIASEPVGAIVYVDGNKIGEAPVSFSVRSVTFQETFVTVKKEGYKTKRFSLRKNINKTALWNLGFVFTTFGALSFATDAGTGTLLEFSPKSYLVDLTTGLSENPSEMLIDRSRGSVSSFILVNEDTLKRDIARGDGESLNELIAWRALPMQSLVKGRILSHREQLLSLTDSVEFMRELKELLNT